MRDTGDLIRLLKQVALEAVNASKPVNVVFGKVINTSPLKIQVEQKLILSSAQLVLTRNVTDYNVTVDVDWGTTSGGDPSHTHKVTGKKQMTIYNSLTVGETVVMIQTTGGQKYIVIDRI